MNKQKKSKTGLLRRNGLWRQSRGKKWIYGGRTCDTGRF